MIYNIFKIIQLAFQDFFFCLILTALHVHMLHSLCHSIPSNHLFQSYIMIINICHLPIHSKHIWWFIPGICSCYHFLYRISHNYLKLFFHHILQRHQSDLSSIALLLSKLYCHDYKYSEISYSTKSLALTAHEIQCLKVSNGLAVISQELRSCGHWCVSCSLSQFHTHLFILFLRFQISYHSVIYTS